MKDLIYLPWFFRRITGLFLSSIRPRIRKDRVRNLELNPDELPESGWTIVNQRNHLMGAAGGHADEVRRARKARKVCAWRCMRDRGNRRSIAITIAPFVTEADAIANSKKVMNGAIRKPFGYTATGANELTGMEIEGVTAPLVQRRTFVGPRGPGSGLIISCAVGSVMVAIDFATETGTWDWQEAAVIAARQVRKIRESLYLDAGV
jgi:hypothetical protein